MDKKKRGLPEYLVMTDCEMSGLDPKKDDLLQVCLIKMKLNQARTEYKLAEPLVLYLKTKKEPSNDFHRKFLTHIFEKAQTSGLSVKEAKAAIDAYLTKDIQWVPTGDCVRCDLEFLYEKGLFERGGYKDDQPVPGTVHYENFEMNPLKCIVEERMGGQKIMLPKSLPVEHDALADCINQALELNHCLKVLLR